MLCVFHPMPPCFPEDLHGFSRSALPLVPADACRHDKAYHPQVVVLLPTAPTCSPTGIHTARRPTRHIVLILARDTR